MRLIADHPHVRAPDLAASVGRETAPFKNDVRKLKALGLTISHSPGYELSPAGTRCCDGWMRDARRRRNACGDDADRCRGVQ